MKVSERREVKMKNILCLCNIIPWYISESTVADISIQMLTTRVLFSTAVSYEWVKHNSLDMLYLPVWCMKRLQVTQSFTWSIERETRCQEIFFILLHTNLTYFGLAFKHSIQIAFFAKVAVFA